MKILITGCSGFIGFHLSKKLMSMGHEIVGIDMMNSYYDVNLKKTRLKHLIEISNNNFDFFKININSKKNTNSIFNKYKFDRVINLAAQAGVRDSLKYPNKYLNYNIKGFLNILELCTLHKIKHLVFASTSSIYGLNKSYPYKESDAANHQMQFYAVTKKTNELMAHTWSHLYNLPTTGLRFFTVYGPWGRPDMALYKFTENIKNGKPINLHNNGDHIRDFTYVDDIVNGIILAMKKIPKGNPVNTKINSSNSYSPFKIYNLGCGNEVRLTYFISLIEKQLNKKAIINNLPLQPGDVHKTSADITLAQKNLGYNPKTKVEVGIKNFVKWYLDYKKK
jgi:UDP-glucuronate 4-epimerase|tara:strand:+ start:4252 stop:5259 length:1008 start_codon:yes stop_codon:yes gene_type:complete